MRDYVDSEGTAEVQSRLLNLVRVNSASDRLDGSKSMASQDPAREAEVQLDLVLSSILFHFWLLPHLVSAGPGPGPGAPVPSVKSPTN